jgi:hypothetical protein
MMMSFFQEGGTAMYPVLVIGLILVWSGCRYAIDLEPARRSFVGALSLAHLVFIAEGVVTDVATVFWSLSDETRWSAERRPLILLKGLKESSRPAILGLGLLGLALLAVAIGVYRAGLRELRAARG